MCVAFSSQCTACLLRNVPQQLHTAVKHSAGVVPEADACPIHCNVAAVAAGADCDACKLLDTDCPSRLACCMVARKANKKLWSSAHMHLWLWLV
jgi:hypothetical protein